MKVMIRSNTLKLNECIPQTHTHAIYAVTAMMISSSSFIYFNWLFIAVFFSLHPIQVFRKRFIPSNFIANILFLPSVCCNSIASSMLDHIEIYMLIVCCILHGMGVALIRIQSGGMVICDRIINFLDA